MLHADRECGTGGQGPLVVLGNFCMLCLEVPGQAPELSPRQASGSWDLAAAPPACAARGQLICCFQSLREKALCSTFFPCLCEAAPGLKGPCPTHVSGGAQRGLGNSSVLALRFPVLIRQARAQPGCVQTKASNAKQRPIVREDKAAVGRGSGRATGPIPASSREGN